MTHKGLHTHRFKDNPLEKAFAKAWKSKNDYPRTRLLVYLMGDGQKEGIVTQDEATKGATVIQWLGSHVGQCFLAEVLSGPEALDFRERLNEQLGKCRGDNHDYKPGTGQCAKCGHQLTESDR